MSGVAARALALSILVFFALFIAGVGLAIMSPQALIESLEPVPSKYLLIQLSFVISALGAIAVYWQLRMPRASKVILGVVRMCYVIGLGLIAAPPMIFGFEKLSIVLAGTVYVDVSIGDSAAWTVPGAVACVICARWCAKDYREIRQVEFEKGLIPWI